MRCTKCREKFDPVAAQKVGAKVRMMPKRDLEQQLYRVDVIVQCPHCLEEGRGYCVMPFESRNSAIEFRNKILLEVNDGILNR